MGDLPLRGQDLDGLDADTRRRLREISFVFIGVAVMLPPLAVRYVFLGMQLIALVMATTTVFAIGALALLRRTHDARLVGVVGSLLLFVQLLASAAVTGGYDGPMMSWFYILPIFGAFLIGPRAGGALTVLVIVVSAVFWRLPHMGVEVPNMIPLAHRDLQSFIPRVTSLVTLGALLVALNSQRRFITSRLRDESEAQREQREKATLAQREAELANSAKIRFLANLSHELRTPLSTIVGYSEMIVEDQQEEGEVSDDIGHILGAATQLSHLFESLFFLTSIESGAFVVSPSRFSPREPLSGLMAEFESTADQKGVELVLECAEGLSVETDAALLQHLLRGLLDNAVKFTEAGRVSLRARRDEASGEVCVEVEDTGVGMSPEVLARAFEQFSQADDFDERVHDGLGLGLSLCARLASMLDARIDLGSRLGEGTLARVYLPESA